MDYVINHIIVKIKKILDFLIKQVDIVNIKKFKHQIFRDGRGTLK
jgi:hypothetical protein